tara:strand:- start:152 stop:550 length:399 start_codon:yes stop_codon:yes gene_type:complete
MKKNINIIILSIFFSLIFSKMNLTMGNFYIEDQGNYISDQSFGIHLDVNDNTTFGWEGGYLMVGLDGPNESIIRLIYSPAVKLGVSYEWWKGNGNGWNTNLSTAIDFTLVDYDNDDEADFRVTLNLGFDLGL